MTLLYFLIMALLTAGAFVAARRRAVAVAGGHQAALHSRPNHHGYLAAFAVLLPMLAIFSFGMPFVERAAKSAAFATMPAEITADVLKRAVATRDIENFATGKFAGEAPRAVKEAAAALTSTRENGRATVFGLGLLTAAAGFLLVRGRITLAFRARNRFEAVVRIILIACAAIAVLTTIGIVFSVLFETFRFFFDPSLKGRPTVSEFLFGTEWNPQAAMRADQGDIRTAFGFLPLLTGTLLITLIAMLVAGPLGLFSAIYLAEYAGPRVRGAAKPVLEILAGIPTVVLGFFAALTVAPLVRAAGERMGLDVASESALAAGLVMGMMIIPFISSLADDVINAVPQSLRDGAYALGSTKSETIRRVVLPAALPGIVSAFMLAVSRAVGETMIVVMAAGLAAKLSFNPLDAVTTITVQIKTILVGDQEFDSAKTLAAFALGFVLFFVTLVLNVIALQIVRRYREQYD